MIRKRQDDEGSTAGIKNMSDMFTIVNGQIIKEKLCAKLINYICIFVKGNFLSQRIDIVAGLSFVVTARKIGSNLHS